ncbi:MAG: hypothetical protein UT24_C0015G0018 [Candidatus Woesebacteria bacterium GW2011_GWB1_39_12]|uniref:Uncharacterized protein n=1 Tax=Candidatus Woesebacteria bacterium GW2011_GWB1_39_12 TaxID=1618574 RepID=A0A0G0PPW9_9BACT|nr:MAG: hypothetical protein UT24_C0015G0018 [Candidatus Woesebacteria bacterium GW2011_GWB1_39_12]
MISETRKVLLNKSYGGFELPKVVADYLQEQKGWDIPVIRVEEDFKKYSASLLCLCEMYGQGRLVSGNDHYRSEEQIRFHPDVIEAVVAMKEKHQELFDLSPRQMTEEQEAEYNKVRCLESIKVVEIVIETDIDNYDGIEKLEVRCYEKF